MGNLSFVERNMGSLVNTRLACATTLLATVATYLLYGAFRGRSRAPGPPRLPFLGNILQMPSELQFIKFAEWAKTYGL